MQKLFSIVIFAASCFLSFSVQGLHDGKHGMPIFEEASAVMSDVNTKLTQNDSFFPPPFIPATVQPVPEELLLSTPLASKIPSPDDDDEDEKPAVTKPSKARKDSKSSPQDGSGDEPSSPPAEDKPENNQDEAEVPSGMMFVRMTKQGLDKATGWIEELAATVMKTYPLREVHEKVHKITNLTASWRKERPKFSTFFDSSGRILVHIYINNHQISGQCQVEDDDDDPSTPTPSFNASVDGFTTSLQLGVVRGPSGDPSLKIESCQSAGCIRQLTITDFEGDIGETREILWRRVSTLLGDAWCQAAQFATSTVNAVLFGYRKPVQASLATSLDAPYDSIDFKRVCGQDVGETISPFQNLLSFFGQGASFDFTMNHQRALFTPNEITMGLRGDLVVQGMERSFFRPVFIAPSVGGNNVVVPPFCFVLGESFHEGILHYAYLKGLLNTHSNLEKNDIPVDIRSKVRTICPTATCHVMANSSCLEQPTVEMSNVTNAIVYANLKVVIGGLVTSRGLWKPMVDVQVRISAVLSFLSQGDTLKVRVEPGQKRFKVQQLRILAPSLAGDYAQVVALVEQAYERRLWPKINGRLVDLFFANQGGVPMRSYCGLTVESWSRFSGSVEGRLEICHALSFNHTALFSRLKLTRQV